MRTHSSQPHEVRPPSFDEIIAYEQGELDEEQTIDLFQQLVDCGLAWRLQGHYGRTAMDLINAGLVTPPRKADLREGRA